ncbi:hypothetical protein [Roseinatronobacter monicus]|uniref:hypothetical protein n=1 Tax=Roseinatronobacter monicus TaxID=393481 RepID=UPI001150B15F|nr:hypothetical protein [Roseinatronobacter monicus]
MSHVWLIESLVELRTYAAQSGLPELAKHLDGAIQLAHLEITLREGGEAPIASNGPDVAGSDD